VDDSTPDDAGPRLAEGQSDAMNASAEWAAAALLSVLGVCTLIGWIAWLKYERADRTRYDAARDCADELARNYGARLEWDEEGFPSVQMTRDGG
jgi:hypothetical protein